MSLDNIIKNFENRKFEENKNKEKELNENNNEVEYGLKILQTIVVPTFKEIISKLEASGHKAKIKEGFSCTVHPRIELEYRPFVKSGVYSEFSSPSKLEVRHYNKEQLRINYNILGTDKDNENVNYSKFTKENFEKDVLKFIEYVLDEL